MDVSSTITKKKRKINNNNIFDFSHQSYYEVFKSETA